MNKEILPMNDEQPPNPQSQELPVGYHLHQHRLAAGTYTLQPFTTAAAILTVGARSATLSVSGIIIPERETEEGVLIKSTSLIWNEIVQALGNDWTLAYQIPPEKWEEIVAGAFNKAQYEVTLTPRSRDYGRDVIAIKRGVGCVKIIGSVKRYAPGNLVEYDDIRALLGVLSSERDASKGIITTTSDFPPRVKEDKFIAPFIPTRLELMNGEALQRWLQELAANNEVK
jgi:restriction system protein